MVSACCVPFSSSSMTYDTIQYFQTIIPFPWLHHHTQIGDWTPNKMLALGGPKMVRKGNNTIANKTRIITSIIVSNWRRWWTPCFPSLGSLSLSLLLLFVDVVHGNRAPPRGLCILSTRLVRLSGNQSSYSCSWPSLHLFHDSNLPNARKSSSSSHLFILYFAQVRPSVFRRRYRLTCLANKIYM